MKILTLNSHSHIEENYKEKINIFVNEIAIEKPDIIALQEVNQSIQNPLAYCDDYFVPTVGSPPIKTDNHALRVVSELKKKGIQYYFTWLGIKNGYEKYDEGLAFLSLSPIEKTDGIILSKTADYKNWKKRMALGTLINNTWFYNVHMGWWDDAEEPFEKQWSTLSSHLKKFNNLWLMGDFNSPAHKKNEGYSLIEKSGYFDSFHLAKVKDSGVTVESKIDGWEENPFGLRIDMIWSKLSRPIKSSNVVFKGNKIVSDHYGVMIEI